MLRLEYATLREHTNHTYHRSYIKYIKKNSDKGQRCVHQMEGNRV